MAGPLFRKEGGKPCVKGCTMLSHSHCSKEHKWHEKRVINVKKTLLVGPHFLIHVLLVAGRDTGVSVRWGMRIKLADIHVGSFIAATTGSIGCDVKSCAICLIGNVDLVRSSPVSGCRLGSNKTSCYLSPVNGCRFGSNKHNVTPRQ